jgi:signal transduction histidine kinase
VRQIDAAVDVQGEGIGDLPPDVKVALYRIAQEALNNVAKHAAASQATVTLNALSPGLTPRSQGYRGGRFELTIADDGRGFDVTDIPPDHLGVGIMHERAEAIGATLTVESEVGRGTVVTVVWTKEDGQ